MQLTLCFTKNRHCFVVLLFIQFGLLLLVAWWAGSTVNLFAEVDEELQADQSLIGVISASDINWVIAGDYWEKLTMGMNSFFDLATVAQQWNAAMPFPFTYRSFLFGMPGYGRRKLDTIYDTQRLNRLMSQYNLSLFSTFGHFLRSASRQVIALEIKYGEVRDSLGRHIYNSSCTKNTKKLIARLNSVTHKHSAKQFTVKKCCYVLAAHGTSPHEISSLCGFNMFDRITILIDQWRGYNDRRTFRLIMKKFYVPHPNPGTPLPYSKKIIETSTSLLRKHLNDSLSTKFVGVHLRSEKVMLKTRSVTIINQCFEKVYQLSHEIASNYSGIPVIYFGDRYSYLVFGKQLSETNINILECHTHSLFSRERNSAFDVLVEQDMVSRAEVLIMLGGGSFQMQILSQYRTLPNTRLAYQVCDEARHKPNDYLTMTRL